MKKLDKFPYEHVVDCIHKIVWINWNGNGQIGLYGVPHLVEKYYPGYTGKIASKEYLDILKNQLVN
jgi:hypothetical protein